MVGLIAMNCSHFLLNLVRVCEQFALLRGRSGKHSELVELTRKKTHLYYLCVHIKLPNTTKEPLENELNKTVL